MKNLGRDISPDHIHNDSGLYDVASLIFAFCDVRTSKDESVN